MLYASLFRVRKLYSAKPVITTTNTLILFEQLLKSNNFKTFLIEKVASDTFLQQDEYFLKLVL